jgi:3-hydroxyacyl-CoA dehydrogenase/enoyl-CoA hydratase/3-hydroxybutyryl-CoA epimerase
MHAFKHWRFEREGNDGAGLAWLYFDKAESSTNTFTPEVMDELGRLLDEFDRESPKGLIILSAKPAGFIAGADIEGFTRLDTPQAARNLVQGGWDLFNRLAAVRYPTLALVRGHCMGGGLELALACRYRIAVDEPGTRLALPEVMLGIVPGWGGMLRLPQVIGPAAALDMMLTGKGVDAKKAKKLGLADECVPPRVMMNAARLLVLSGRPPRELPFMQKLMNGPLKGMVAAQARKQVAKRARPQHYPAPYAILDMWAHHGGNALAVPRDKPTSLDAIFGSATTKNLVRVYYLQERLKGFGKDSDFAPKHLHVVGAGIMGGDIAAWAALRGMTVTLQDQSIERIAPAIKRAAAFYKKKLKDDMQVRLALDRLIPDPSGQGVRQADVVIEAIFENLEAKQKLFSGMEPLLKPGAVLATNTSSLKLEDIGATLADPTRLIGIHFFNPVAMMPLVEVVEGKGTDPAALKKGLAFVRRIDKLALPVKSAPGFLVNAVLAPYMQEAMRCVDEGIAPETVDEAAQAFGMPLGPIELADTVGLDIAVAAGKSLAGANAAPPKKLLELVAAGHIGRKSGRGYYTYAHGKPQKGAAGQVPAGLAERLVKPLLQAAQRCVAEGVVADEELADAGVIFGTGFAPFTGGPMNYLKEQA